MTYYGVYRYVWLLRFFKESIMTEAKITSAKKLMAEKLKAAPKPAAKKPKPKPKAKTKSTAKPAAKTAKAASNKPDVAVNSASAMLKDFYSSLNNAANSALGK